MATDKQEITRVHFFDGQFLRPQDFNDEQAYHVAMRRRHQIAHHTWGIVRGLELTPEDGEVYVRPGTAVDGYGRDLYLAEKFYLSPGDFDLNGDAVDVYLEYDRLSLERPVGGACDPALVAADRLAGDVASAASAALRQAADQFSTPDGESDGVARALESVRSLLHRLQDGPGPAEGPTIDRWRERPRVRVEPARGRVDRRRPEEVPPGDQDFEATRTPPDDPAETWPVFLGQVTRNPDRTYTVDPAGRPYAGLRGEAVEAASGRASVRFRGEIPASEPYGFAVYVEESSGQAGAATGSGSRSAQPKTAGMTDPRLRLGITPEGCVHMRGKAALLAGNLTLANGSVYFKEPGPVATAPATAGATDPPSVQPRPWQIFRQIRAPGPSDDLSATPKDSKNGAAGSPLKDTIDELCVEIPVGDGTTRNQFVIGSSTKDGKFFPALTIDDRGVVTVHGNLVVEGTITEANRVSGSTAPDAQNFIAGITSTGQVLGSSLLLGKSSLFGSNKEVALDYIKTDEGRAVVADAMVADPVSLGALAERIEDKDEHTDAFVGKLDSTRMNRLVTSLTKSGPQTDALVAGLRAASRMRPLAEALARGADGMRDLITELTNDDARTSALVAGLLQANGVGSLVDALARDANGMPALADGLKDNTTAARRMDGFVEALASGTGNDRMAAFAGSLSDNATPAKRMDQFAAALAGLNQNAGMAAFAGSLIDARVIDKFVDALADAAHTNRMEGFVVSLARGMDAAPPPPPDHRPMIQFVQAVVGQNVMDALVKALAAAGMDAFAGSLAGGGGAAMDALTASLARGATEADAKGMGDFVESLVREPDPGGGAPKPRMNALSVGLKTKNGMAPFAATLAVGGKMGDLGASIRGDQDQIVRLLDALTTTDSGKTTLANLALGLARAEGDGTQPRLEAFARGLEHELHWAAGDQPDHPERATGATRELVVMAESIPSAGSLTHNFETLSIFLKRAPDNPDIKDKVYPPPPPGH